jgi:cytidine deaminase
MIIDSLIKQMQKLASRVEKQSSYRYKVSAVIFNKRKIISFGINKIKTSPELKKYFKYGTCHAEIDAVMHSMTDVKGYSIFVYRETRDGKLANAKPCPQCVQFLKENGIKYAYWTMEKFPFFAYDTIDNLYNKIDKKLAFLINKYPDDKNIPRILIAMKDDKKKDYEEVAALLPK